MGPTPIQRCSRPRRELRVGIVGSMGVERRHARHSKSNLRMCIDGARKSSGRSAGGMVVYGYQDSGDKVLLYRAGVDFGTLSSTFLAETMALEWALDIFFSIVLRT